MKGKDRVLALLVQFRLLLFSLSVKIEFSIKLGHLKLSIYHFFLLIFNKSFRQVAPLLFTVAPLIFTAAHLLFIVTLLLFIVAPLFFAHDAC